MKAYGDCIRWACRHCASTTRTRPRCSARSRCSRRVFGYKSFRSRQYDIVATLIGGGDALVLMPTGGGKSLCYQIPALVRDGVGVVVSPLIALMQDQVDALKQVGVAAAYPQLDARPAPAERGRAPARRRRARYPLRRARAAGAGAHAVADRAGPGLAVRDRRGALRVAVGPRLPARVPAIARARRALPERAARGADRDRRRAHAGGDRHRAQARERGPLRRQLRPAQHPLHHRGDGQHRRARAAVAVHRRRASQRRRHRLLPVAQVGRGDRGLADSQGPHRARLSRRPARRRAPPHAGALPGRGRARRVRHDRVRHGHRQARRALRRPPQPAQDDRELLPGDRPRRPRRRAGQRLDGLRPAGRDAAAPAGSTSRTAARRSRRRSARSSTR